MDVEELDSDTQKQNTAGRGLNPTEPEPLLCFTELSTNTNYMVSTVTAGASTGPDSWKLTGARLLARTGVFAAPLVDSKAPFKHLGELIIISSNIAFVSDTEDKIRQTEMKLIVVTLKTIKGQVT